MADLFSVGKESTEKCCHRRLSLNFAMSEKSLIMSHPGVILKKEFLEHLVLSAYQVCKATKIDKMSLSFILRGERDIRPAIALRLSRYFGLSDGYFMRLQAAYDTRKTRLELQTELQDIQPLSA
jgi:antitoxin HigA-1